MENQNLKEKIRVLLEQEQSKPPSFLSKIDHAFQFLQEGTFFEPLIEPLITNFKMVRHPHNMSNLFKIFMSLFF